MAPKKKKIPAPKRTANIAAEIENAGVVVEQPITRDAGNTILCPTP